MGALGGAAVLALGPMTAGTASATPAAYEDCAAGLVCVYELPNGGDWLRKWSGVCNFANIGQEGVGDRVSSAANYSDKQVYLLDWNPAIGGWVTLWHMTPGTAGNMPAGTDNRTDAVQICA
jgi:hypothetical protein